MKSLCVYCGSSLGNREEYVMAAESLGIEMAKQEIALVYGGGRVGLMGVVANAVLTAGGSVIGVLPRFLDEKEVGHKGLSELHLVETMHERKAKMADIADGFVALPGGYGTLDEIFEILTWAQLDLHQKPCGLLNAGGYFDLLLAFLDRATTDALLRPAHRSLLLSHSEPEDLLKAMRNFEAQPVLKW